MVDAEIRYLGDVQRLALQPGDVIVLSCPGHLDDAGREHLSAVILGFFPNHKCLVLENGIQIGVIERPTNEFEVVTVDGKVVQRITVD